MPMEVIMPEILPDMPAALIETVYVKVGDEIRVGAKLFDVSLDLGGKFYQNCPPISYYRIIAREKGWVRELHISPGNTRDAGAPLALITAAPDGPGDTSPARALRLTTAGILWHGKMWSADTVT